MNIARQLSRYFYIAVEACPDGDVVIQEFKLCEADASYADAKTAISNATWRVAKIYRINFALGEIKDVSAETAVKLWQEVQDAGETVDESVYRDFIRDHIPASYDVGYRGTPDRDDDYEAQIGTGDAGLLANLRSAAE